VKAEIDAAVKELDARTEFKPDTQFDHVWSTPHPNIERQRAEFLAALEDAKHG
jgi:TPP-dependent pyruvate/acetoin dehydrogenase alpha subunit